MDSKAGPIVSAILGSIIGIAIVLVPSGGYILIRWYYYVNDCSYWLPGWFCSIYGISPIFYFGLIVLALILGIKGGQKNYQSKQSKISAFTGGLAAGAISMIVATVGMIVLQWLLVFLVDKTPFENF